MKNDFARSLVSNIPKWIRRVVKKKNEFVFYILPEYTFNVFYFLKNHTNTRYKLLIDICTVDFVSRKERFELVYNLLSLQFNSRIRIKTCVDELTPVSSIVKVYKASGWFEREVWDLSGIFFSNHPDLRRILTDYGFEGHPLRKDFPLSGYSEIRYDDAEKRVIMESIEMPAEFRYFKFSSPWELIK